VPGGDPGHQLSELLAGHETVDLTLPLAEQLPGTWPGHMPFRATVWTWFADRPGDPQPVRPQTGGGYQTRWLVMDEHTGTHVDAPRHFIPPPGSQLPHAAPAGDIGVDRLPLLAAAGPASVVDVTRLGGTTSGGASPPVTVAELTAWEDAHGPVRAGDVLLAGLSRRMVFVEALTGLERLPARGAWFLFLPLNLVDGPGAPGRAIAVLP
jgi:kynurenine formamidase